VTAMKSPESSSERAVPRRNVGVKGLLAMMAGFVVVFIILAELASATTNDQPAISSTTDPTTVATDPVQTPATTPAEVATESPAVAQPRSLTYGAHEIIKMYKGGVKADVLLTYIDTSNLSYQLSSREILYLSQIGVPSEIVNAMIRRDHQTELAKSEARQQTETAPTAAGPPPLPSVVYSQPVVIVQQPKVKYVSAPVCATPVYQPNPNVTIIGSRSGSALFNGGYGLYACSPARSYFNSAFGYGYGSSLYEFGCGPRYNFAYDGFRGGYGNGFGRHRFGLF